MAGGFKYVGSDSQDPMGKIKLFNVDVGHATRITKGDVVRLTGTSTAAIGIPEVDAATAAQTITGVVAGVVPNYATESFTDTGLAASVAGTVLVVTDPFALYEVDVSNGPLVVADVGLNADLVATASTLSGGLSQSNMTLNATGKNTTSTLQFRITKILSDSAGVFGNRAQVRINSTTTVAGATGV